jgi:hypothetical protein
VLQKVEFIHCADWYPVENPSVRARNVHCTTIKKLHCVCVRPEMRYCLVTKEMLPLLSLHFDLMCPAFEASLRTDAEYTHFLQLPEGGVACQILGL